MTDPLSPDAIIRELNGNAVQPTLAIAHNGKPAPTTESDRIDAILQRTRVYLTDNIPEPPVCLRVNSESGSSVIGTLGNFTVIIGKAKSRKTFAIGSITAAAITPGNPQIGGIEGVAPTDRKVVLYFDTEQSPYHFQRSLRRIGKQAGIDDPPNLESYGLRSVATADRILAIERKIYNTPGLYMVIIDGVRDLAYSINSEEEATSVSSHLLRWTQELDIHIVVVLHQNKGDQSARGHLGTELVNKAESVLSVTKGADGDKHLSTVAPEQCRDIDFEPFSFSIDSDGLPYSADTPERSSAPGRSTKRDHTPDEVDSLIGWAFRSHTHLGYSRLLSGLLAAGAHIGRPLSKHKAEAIIINATNNGHFGKEKVNGKGYEQYYRITS
jgi:hypothetical protein